MTVEGEHEDMLPGPSSSKPHEENTPASKLGFKYFDKEMCYAPLRQNGKSSIEICKTLLPVLDSPMSPPQHEKGPSLNTPLTQTTQAEFHASNHVQNTMPYQNVSEIRYTGCMVCDRSVDAIMNEEVEWYMQHITRLRKEVYENGLNAGCFLFITPAVSQAAACDGTTVTTSAIGQEFVPGTLPIY